MAIDLSTQLHASALSVHAVVHPEAESRRFVPHPVVQVPEEMPPPLSQSTREIHKMVAQMNDLAQVMNHKLSFSIDYETKDIIVKVVDANTDKVIRELPPAELQKLHKSIKEAVGLLIDKLI